MKFNMSSGKVQNEHKIASHKTLKSQLDLKNWYFKILSAWNYNLTQKVADPLVVVMPDQLQYVN